MESEQNEFHKNFKVFNFSQKKFEKCWISWKKWNFQKNSKFSKFFKLANFCPKRFGESALESWNHELLKNKHLRIIRHHLLCVFNTFEEAWIWWFFLILKEHFLNPSSTTAEIKGNWGRMKFFFIFQKYKLSAFKRTFSRLIWPISRRERSEWTFYIFGFFCYKNPKSGNKQPHPLREL